MSHSSLAAMSRIRKRRRALKRGRAQVTVESARVTGETIITAGMTPEREAEVRKQYYRDHEPTPAPAALPKHILELADATTEVAEAALTIERARVTEEREAERRRIRKQYYRDHEPAATDVRCGNEKYGDRPDLARLPMCACTVESGCVTTDPAAQAKLRKATEPKAADNITPEYLAMLRHDCLVAVNTQLRGASAEEVVRAAAADLEARLRFLRGQS